MCTVTLLRQSNGLRLFMNRDEAHSRKPALEPKLLVEESKVYAPIDPQGGGTWIAYNEKGYWGCLLNGYFERPTEDKESVQSVVAVSYPSRGLILPKLLSSKDPLQAIEQFDPTEYASFRLLVGNAQEFTLKVWDGITYQDATFHHQVMDKAFFLTSSSWRQEEVIEARSALFKAWAKSHITSLDNCSDTPEYHWRSNLPPAVAPFMHRPVSATQSITSLAISSDGIQMGYQSIDQEMHNQLCSSFN